VTVVSLMLRRAARQFARPTVWHGRRRSRPAWRQPSRPPLRATTPPCWRCSSRRSATRWSSPALRAASGQRPGEDPRTRTGNRGPTSSSERPPGLRPTGSWSASSRSLRAPPPAGPCPGGGSGGHRAGSPKSSASSTPSTVAAARRNPGHASIRRARPSRAGLEARRSGATATPDRRASRMLASRFGGGDCSNVIHMAGAINNVAWPAQTA
jgi:hypothetical protein